MLRNLNLVNKEVGTVFGALKFDANGECRQLKAEEEKVFAKIRGFEVVVEKAFEEVAKEKSPKKPVAKKDEDK